MPYFQLEKMMILIIWDSNEALFIVPIQSIMINVLTVNNRLLTFPCFYKNG